MTKEYNPKYKRDKSKEKFEILKAQIEEIFNQEHTFKPTTNYSNVFIALEKPNNESKEEIYKRLSAPKILELNKRLKEKEINDQKKLSEECTFKPIIKPLLNIDELNTSNNCNNNNIYSGKEKVENRLYKLADQLKEKREKLKRESQDQQTNSYSFAPNIDANSKQLMLKYENKKPLHERYEEILKNKKQNLQSMRMNIEKDERSLYNPKINSKSKNIIMNKTDRSFNQELSIHERLYREGLQNNKIKNNINPLEDDECTFSPNLFYSTITPGGNIDDFLERQKIYEEIKKERLERKLSKSIEHSVYTFSPKINLTSDILMKADHSRANEDIKGKVDRLYKDDFDKIKSRKEQLEKFYYAQYDFKPKINDISRFVGKDNTYEDLAMKKESSKTKKYRQDRNKDETYGCTFKPKINKDNKYFDNVQSNYKSDEGMLKRIQSEVRFKNERVEEIKA